MTERARKHLTTASGIAAVAVAVGFGLFWVQIHWQHVPAGQSRQIPGVEAPCILSPTDERTVLASGPPPTEAILEFNEALTANDPDLYAKHHLRGTQDEEAYADGVKAVLGAQRRMIAAFKSKIDPNDISSLPLGSFYIVPLSNEQIRGMRVISIDGKTADVSVPHFPTYRVILVEGQWHIQITPTIASRFPSDPARAMHLLTEMFQDVAAAFDHTSDQILQGQLTSQGEIFEVISARVKELTAIYQSRLPPMANG